MRAIRPGILTALLLSGIFTAAAPAALAQPKPTVQPASAAVAAPSEDEVAAIRGQALNLLRMSPTLTQVVETDPNILADQEYVTRANPQLAQFLVQHPEVVRNPDFYLFSNITGEAGRRAGSLQHRSENNEPMTEAQLHREYVNSFETGGTLIVVIGSFIWLIRILFENRRWSRVFRLQSEVHSKLIDRFASNQELLHYMETEPGKRFLEAAPIPVAVDRDQRLPGGLGRVLGPLQFGIVLTLLGTGLLILERNLPELSDGLLILGVIALMPGVGFIISALITWRISARLGLMPQQPTQPLDRQ